MIYEMSGNASSENTNGAIALHFSVTRLRISVGESASAPTPIPLIIQTNTVLSHIASSKTKKAAASALVEAVLANCARSSSPSTSSRCCGATGPQSKQVGE